MNAIGTATRTNEATDAAEAIAAADPVLLLASLAMWRGTPELVDEYAGSFHKVDQTGDLRRSG